MAGNRDSSFSLSTLRVFLKLPVFHMESGSSRRSSTLDDLCLPVLPPRLFHVRRLSFSLTLSRTTLPSEFGSSSASCALVSWAV